MTEPVMWQQVVKSGAEQNWQDKREADFQVSLRRWHDALLTLPSSILIVQQMRELRTTTERLRMLRDIHPASRGVAAHTACFFGP